MSETEMRHLTFWRFHYFHLSVACKNPWTTGNLEMFFDSLEQLRLWSQRLPVKSLQFVLQSLPWFDGSCMVWPWDNLYHRISGPQQNWNFYDFCKNIGRNSLSNEQHEGFLLRNIWTTLLAWTRIYTIRLDLLKPCFAKEPYWRNIPLHRV